MGKALVFGPRRCVFDSCIPKMYNLFIRPFTLSKALKSKSYVLKINKFNLIFLKLFQRLGLMSSFNLNYDMIKKKKFVKRIIVYYQKTDSSMIYNNFKFFKKHSFGFILSKKALNFVSRNTRIAYIISSDKGYKFNKEVNNEGGKLVMSIVR